MGEEYSDTHSNEQEKKSKYNSAIAILYRLDDLWKDSHRHSRDAMYVKWNEDLDRIWLELIADASDEDKDNMKKLNDSIKATFIYAHFEKLKNLNPMLFSKLLNVQKSNLMEKESFLRILQNSQGKGSAYEDSMEDYMDDF